MQQWKVGYIILILIYLVANSIFFFMSYQSLSITELISLVIASIALLISLIQMAENNKKKRPIRCEVKLWGSRKGKYFRLTLKFTNLDAMPIHGFSFRLRLPKGIYKSPSKSGYNFDHHSYGYTDVIQSHDIDFLGGKKSGFESESLEVYLDLNKPIASNRIFSLVLSNAELEPTRQILNSDQIESLKEGNHTSEKIALIFSK
jgi:hypothetical protein